MLILTVVSLLQVEGKLGLNGLIKKKSDAFDIANNLLVSKTTSDWLSLNKEAARELIATEKDRNVKDVLTKLSNLRAKYEDCDETSQRQLEELIDLMYSQSLLDPTKEAVSKRRLNNLVMRSLEALYVTCLDKFKEQLPEVDKEHGWIVSRPEKLTFLIDYDASWNRGRLGVRLVWPQPFSRPPLESYRKANYDEIRRLSSDRVRKAWMYFFLGFLDTKRPVLDRNPRNLKWIVPRNNVVELYDHYVTKSCQVFKPNQMASLMSKVETFVNRWRIDPRKFPFEKDYILSVMLNSRICKELEKKDKEVMLDRITKTFDSKLKEDLMEYFEVK